MKPQRVCLIHPPTLTSPDAYGLDAVAPLGLAYVASALKGAGHLVSAVDGVGEALQQYGRVTGHPDLLLHGMTSSDVVGRIDPDADVIGISNMFSNQWLFVRELAEEIRRAFPNKLIVLGGEHVTACAAHVLKTCPAVDVCVLGEGEETMPALVGAHAARQGLDGVAGIMYRNGLELAAPPRRPRIRAIDDIAEPDWSLVPVEKYMDNACTYGFNIGRSMPMLASRGCPFECTFCSSPEMWTPYWHARRPDLVLAEMKKYRERYGATNFDFYDLTAIVKKDWIADFCRLLIKERLDITWQLPSGTRSEALDAEIMDLLYESGCRFIIYAPESGSVEELRRIKKKINLDRMLSSIRAANRRGIETKTNLIFGMLGSTWKDVLNTFVFIFRLAVAGVTDMTGYPFSPYPGSEDFKTLLSRGRVRLDDDYFRGLLALSRNLHTKNTVSYNDAFSSRTLEAVCSCAFIFFYSLSYLIRPWRAVRLVHTSFVKREASSILALAFANVRRKKGVQKLIHAGQAETVVVPPELRIRNKLREDGLSMKPLRWLVKFLKEHGIDDWSAPRWVYHRLAQPLLRHVYPEAVAAISGGSEEFQLSTIEALARPGDVFLDLGANAGYYTLPVAAAIGPHGKVFAFEPEPSNCGVLRRLLERAGLKNVTIVPKAVTERSGRLRLFLSPSNTVDHRIYDTPLGRASIEIESVSLDEHFFDFKDRVDIIKMDLQGAEMLALKGMRRLLERNQAVKLFTEFWPIGLARCGGSPRAFLALLDDLRFRFLLVDEKSCSLRRTSLDDLLRDFDDPAEYDFANLLCLRDWSSIPGLPAD